MVTIIVIVLVCLVSSLLVYAWLMRSLNRARHVMDDGSGGRANSSGSGKGEHP